ncbi:uncharacterized protein LOC114317267 isoform X2 [Camellia sinensis]|nr:uncharacterized protein LOC114317267 isoform X2 [Camellia sinensis]
MSSPWTRSSECKSKEAEGGSTSGKCGTSMPGRNLFKQPKNAAHSVGDMKRPKQRLNFPSNITGLVNMMRMVKWTDLHLVHLRKTPFWLLFKAILENQLPQFKKGGDMVVSIIQSYSVREGKFVIGGQSVDFTDEDVRLLFGLQCGDASLELMASPKPASDFVQRRCQGVSRITTKLVKDLLVKAAKGTTPRDYEDTVKLLCLYACVKLFFSTSGESVSWTFIRYVDNLDAMKSYNWAGAIRSSLMSSIRDFHRTPHKVTGCVIALPYWLCEHTSIVEAKSAHKFPRFLKWNIGELLANARGVKLSEAVSFLVSPGQLVADEREVNILKGEDMVGGEHVDLRDNTVHSGLGGEKEKGGSGLSREVEIGNHDNSTGSNEDVDDVPSTRIMCGRTIMSRPNAVYIGKLLGAKVGTSEPVVAEHDWSFKFEQVAMTGKECRMRNVDKDKLIAKLEEEVATLKRENEMQWGSLVGGSESVLRVKEENKRLAVENVELRRTVTVLEEKLAKQTQRFGIVHVWDGGVAGGTSGDGHNACGVQHHGSTDVCRSHPYVGLLSGENIRELLANFSSSRPKKKSTSKKHCRLSSPTCTESKYNKEYGSFNDDDDDDDERKRSKMREHKMKKHKHSESSPSDEAEFDRHDGSSEDDDDERKSSKKRKDKRKKHKHSESSSSDDAEFDRHRKRSRHRHSYSSLSEDSGSDERRGSKHRHP